MVIASDAQFIFLDEPSTGLDPISRQELWNLMIDLSKDRFIFLTTHYLEEAEMVADRIGILDDGKLLALGSMDELRTKIKTPVQRQGARRAWTCPRSKVRCWSERTARCRS